MAEFRENRRSVINLAVLSCVSGTLTGLLAAVFRLRLQRADHWRDAFIAHAHGWPALMGLALTITVVASASAIAASMGSS